MVSESDICSGSIWNISVLRGIRHLIRCGRDRITFTGSGLRDELEESRDDDTLHGGYGDVTYACSRQLAIKGVGVDAGCVRFATEQYPEIAFEICGPDRTAFQDYEFDVVISSLFLPFMPDAYGYLTEMRRVLMPGRRLVIANNNADVLW